MIFKNEEHKKSYEEFKLRACISEFDKERKSLFYLLALLEETRNNINDLYDFENNWIKHEGLNKGWQTSGSIKVSKLAFNLYNGWKGEDGDDYSPLELFSVSDENREYLLESIRIRFS